MLAKAFEDPVVEGREATAIGGRRNLPRRNDPQSGLSQHGLLDRELQRGTGTARAVDTNNDRLHHPPPRRLGSQPRMAASRRGCRLNDGFQPAARRGNRRASRAGEPHLERAAIAGRPGRVRYDSTGATSGRRVQETESRYQGKLQHMTGSAASSTSGAERRVETGQEFSWPPH